MKRTVLLIDEAQLERKINEWALIHAGYDVITARDGEQASRLAQDKTPDIILLDPILQDVNGHQLLVELKRGPNTAQIPVIVLSTTSQCDGERFKRAGADAIVEKEKTLTDSRLLVDTVEGVLHPVV